MPFNLSNASKFAPANYATLTLATCNVLNFANPGRTFYANHDPYTQNQFQRKAEWLGGRFQALNADVLAVQEVWDLNALKAAVAHSGLQYNTITVPGAENTDAAGQPLSEATSGAHGTPRVGLVTRLAVESMTSLGEFPKGFEVQLPDIGSYNHFERPPLHAKLRMKHGQIVHVITAHLKSKRPKYLQDAQGNPLEDHDDPKITARAALRALVMRGAEAAALRCAVVDILGHTHEPLIVMGDFNDATHSVTTQMIAATSEVAYDKGARDTALYSASDILGEVALKKDVAYSHIYQGSPEVLDQILVSEEFVRGSKFGLGDVRRVDYFNDHLHEGRDGSKSDHGFVRAVLRVRVADAPETTALSVQPPSTS